MNQITKTYSNLKAAHRQWRHTGHCSKVHGENWTIELAIAAETLDSRGFVVDFSELRDVQTFLEENFDHTLLLDKDDPARHEFEEMDRRGLMKIVWLYSASAEGIANFVLENVSPMIAQKTKGRAALAQVRVYEDDKNSAAVDQEVIFAEIV